MTTDQGVLPFFITASTIPRRRPHPFRTPSRTKLSISPQTPPPANNALSNALQQIATFTGTKSQANALQTRLINSLVKTPSNNSETHPDETPTHLFRALHERSFLTAFASARSHSSLTSNKKVSAAHLAAQAGLPLSALSPRRGTVLAWQIAGVIAVAAIVQVTRLAGVEQLARPALIAFGMLFAADQLVMRGAIFESAYRAIFPKYAEKVVKHEAGHFLAAHLHGIVVRGYILSAAEAVQAGIPGQAGTLFSDDEMYAQLKGGKLTSRTIDRYSIVSMAGIAAEAIHYGEAEGGESDVSALLNLLTTLQPPWSEQSVRSQARWAVLEAILLLRRNNLAFKALCEAMRERKSLGECILCIEENFVPAETENNGGHSETSVSSDEAKLQQREQAIVAELERIQKKIRKLEE